MEQLKKSIIYSTTILIACTLFLFSNCGSNGDEEEEDPSAKFVGTWTLGNTYVGITVDGKSLEEFLLDNGASQDEIELVQEELFALLEDAFGEGEIELKADNTYIAKFGSDSDTGTWAYNSSTEKLTINSDDDLQDLDVISVTSSTMVIGLSVVFLGDLDEDGIDDEITVEMEQNYIKS